jgi:two-component system response regulator NreC
MAQRIVIIDDHTLFREALLSLLKSSPWIEIAGDAGDAESGFQLVEREQPALVLLDLQLPGVTGLDLAKRLLQLPAPPRLLILTGVNDMSFVPEAVQIGVAGFLRKEAPSAELIRAIHTVLDDKVYLCSEAATAISDSVRSRHSPHSPSDLLSERESQVLTFVAQGLRNKEIADKLGVSIKSVETYRARLMAKLNCDNAADLMRYAIRNGL